MGFADWGPARRKEAGMIYVKRNTFTPVVFGTGEHREPTWVVWEAQSADVVGVLSVITSHHGGN